MRHFRVLPTDQRYKELTNKQAELLFLNFLDSPTDDEYLRFYREREENESIMEELPEDILKEMEYSEEEIRSIIEAVIK